MIKPVGIVIFLSAFILIIETPISAQEDEELKRLREDAKKEVSEQVPGISKEGEKKKESTQSNLNAFNPRITVFGDLSASWLATGREFVGTSLVDSPWSVPFDRIITRGVELDIRADVDPYAKAVAIVNSEDLLEELYVDFTKFPAGIKCRAGLARIPFGTINRVHAHDLPWLDHPLATKNFLGDEGTTATGATFSKFLFDSPLELSCGIYDGDNEKIFAGTESRHPCFLAHLSLFEEPWKKNEFQFGASYLAGYWDAAGTLTSELSGLDFFYRWRPRDKSTYSSFVLQAELYHMEKEPDTAGTGRHNWFYATGYYVMAQYQIDQNFYVGARYDSSGYMDGIDDAKGQGLGAYISYYTTEFLRFRLGYEYLSSPDTMEKPKGAVVFNLVFVFGSHPAEPYWVNK